MNCSYKNCNNTFEPLYGKLYCSRHCKLKACLARKRSAPIVQSTCTVCGKLFDHKKGTVYCSKECSKSSRSRTVLKNSKSVRNLYSQWLRKYKEECNCSACGISGKEYPEILDFHHVGAKRFSISSVTASNLFKKGNGKSDIMLEISQCVILCANCHRIHHAKSRHVIRYSPD